MKKKIGENHPWVTDDVAKDALLFIVGFCLWSESFDIPEVPRYGI